MQAAHGAPAGRYATGPRRPVRYTEAIRAATGDSLLE